MKKLIFVMTILLGITTLSTTAMAREKNGYCSPGGGFDDSGLPCGGGGGGGGPGGAGSGSGGTIGGLVGDQGNGAPSGSDGSGGDNGSGTGTEGAQPVSDPTVCDELCSKVPGTGCEESCAASPPPSPTNEDFPGGVAEGGAGDTTKPDPYAPVNKDDIEGSCCESFAAGSASTQNCFSSTYGSCRNYLSTYVEACEWMIKLGNNVATCEVHFTEN